MSFETAITGSGVDLPSAEVEKFGLRAGTVECHNVDWKHYVGMKEDGSGWLVVFDRQAVCTLSTRDKARMVIRAVKSDPRLAIIAEVMES